MLMSHLNTLAKMIGVMSGASISTNTCCSP